ncbi:up-regulator of cell proliferation-like [Heterodontus francisci]|uniref:up-regulator of cell proliferation-like n=1 Tax=Heterodontus francisci TaxID=7792 RepID=UPI00355BE239
MGNYMEENQTESQLPPETKTFPQSSWLECMEGNNYPHEAKGGADTSNPSNSDSDANAEKHTRGNDIVKLLTELGLEVFKSQKLSKNDVLNVSTEGLQNKLPVSPQDIPRYFLRNLMMVNSKTRNLKYTPTEAQNLLVKQESDILDFLNADETREGLYHPLDIIMAIFLCADPFLQQELMLKMSLCQFALPVLLPDGNKGCTFLLWAMRSIVKKWCPLSLRASVGFKETNVVIEHMPMFSFIRLGSCSISKSNVLNEVLSTSEQHNFFIHSNMECGNFPRKISNGLTELCWYLPSGSEDLDLFPEPMAILNLRGDAREFHRQVQFLASISSALFIFIDNIDSSLSKNLKSLAQSPASTFVVLAGSSLSGESKKHLKDLITSSALKQNQILLRGNKNSSEFTELLRAKLKNALEQTQNLTGNKQKAAFSECRETVWNSLEELAIIARDMGIEVDEDDNRCTEGKAMSEKICNSIKKEDVSRYKSEKMPFQGSTWQQLSKMEKEQCRPKKQKQKSTQKYCNDLEEDKKRLRNELKKKGVSADMKAFITALTDGTGEERKYFLQWMKFELDCSSRETLSVLREKYKFLYEKSQKESIKQKDYTTNNNRLRELDKSITASSLGLEHFMREIGLIYEILITEENRAHAEESLIQQLPRTAADLMLDGFPLELIDGDVSNIALWWVTAVLKEVEHKVGRETRVFVLTVLGVQSTGKSTLLNTMFGLQFAVSSGRCTRGAFMQLIKIAGDLQTEMGCGYIMVIDTEGLKAPELSNIDDMIEHDNELATLVIGLSDVTLVNMAMENSTEMKDVLQIAVHAFIRMKEVGKRPTCHFVYQNVSDVSAHDQNMRGRKHLLEQLDMMTRAAAKMEKQDRRFTKFSDVLDYDAKENNWNIPGLWHGNPPMAAVNTGYSQKVFELKKMLFKSFTSHQNKRKFSTISEFIEWTQSLWKAVKYENFIFNFQNSLVAEAYNELSIKYTDLEWELRKVIHNFMEMAENRIFNAEDNPESVAQNLKKDRVLFLEEKKQKALQELEDYFSNNSNANLVEKYRFDFVCSIDSVIMERALYVDSKIDEEVQRWRYRQKLNDIKASYESQIEKQVNELLQMCSKEKRDMDATQLEKEFNVMWRQTVSTFEQKPLREINIAGDMETLLLQNMTANSRLLNEKLSRDNLLELGIANFQVIEEHIDMLTLVNDASANTFPMNVQLNASDMARAQQQVVWWVDECKQFVKQTADRKQDYDPNHCRELLKVIDEKIRKHQDERFTFTKHFSVHFKLHICGFAMDKYQEMHEQFRKTNDPLQNLQQARENYCESFKNTYQEKDQTKQKAEIFCKECLKPAIIKAVEMKLASQIVEEVKSNCTCKEFTIRKYFHVALMLYLKEKNSFDEYYRYIKQTESFEKDWLKEQFTQYCAANSEGQPLLCTVALKILGMVINMVKSTLVDSTVQITENSVSGVIHTFKEKLKHELQIPLDKLGQVSFQSGNINPKYFKEEAANYINVVNDDLTESIEDWKNYIDRKIAALPTDPCSELYAMLSGCGEACPFCGVLCDCTNKVHSQHSTEYHRCQGLNGYSNINSGNLVSENCTMEVASDTSFRNKDTDGKWFPYKNYRNLNERYSRWSIPADTSIQTSAFWKWVFCKYNKQFADRYSAKPANDISSWDLSWDHVKKDIEDRYNVNIDTFN